MLKVVQPIDAAKPMSCAFNLLPDFKTTEPFLMSSPLKRRLAPRFIPVGIVTIASSTWQSSCIKTVSVPLGMSAPVNIL